MKFPTPSTLSIILYISAIAVPYSKWFQDINDDKGPFVLLFLMYLLSFILGIIGAIKFIQSENKTSFYSIINITAPALWIGLIIYLLLTDGMEAL